MAILGLEIAEPIHGFTKRQKRTMTPQNTSAALVGNGQGGGSGFAAAKMSRLTMDFIASQRSADQDLWGDNIRLRARARQLAIDNPHARKFLAMVKQNVVGEHGIQMKSKVTGANVNDTAATDKINQRIEEEFKRWSKMGRCTADGRFSFAELQQMAIVNCAREGENLVKFVYGEQFNDCKFAVQTLDNDQLDDNMMQPNGSDGGAIRMGVEVDKYRRPLGYWLWNGHPTDFLPGNRERKRVPAGLIVHTAVWERPSQTRGYTWMSAAILPLKHYGGWEEATLVAARSSAAKFFSIEKDYPDGTGFEDEDEAGDDTNSDGTQMMTANSGEGLSLDFGEHLKFHDPKFPTNTYKEFSQAALRSVASGLLISYPSLANDLEGVNFSSIRAGLIEERDMWRVIQRWFIHHFCEPIRLAWLKMALLTTLSDISLSPAQMEQVAWMARGWAWVDPQKDANSTILKLGEGLTTYEIECGAIGLDWQEVAKQRKREDEYFASIGVVYGVDITGDQGGKGVAAGDEAEAAKVSGAGQGKGK